MKESREIVLFCSAFLATLFLVVEMLAMQICSWNPSDYLHQEGRTMHFYIFLGILVILKALISRENSLLLLEKRTYSRLRQGHVSVQGSILG